MYVPRCSSIRPQRRLHGEIVRHHERVLAPAAVRGPPPGFAVAELRVELAGAGVAFTKLELDEEDAGRARRRLEPVEQLSADTLHAIAGPHRQKTEMSVRIQELHDTEA